jgi:hypothetical protein
VEFDERKKMDVENCLRSQPYTENFVDIKFYDFYIMLVGNDDVYHVYRRNFN